MSKSGSVPVSADSNARLVCLADRCSGWFIDAEHGPSMILQDAASNGLARRGCATRRADLAATFWPHLPSARPPQPD